MTYSKFTLPAIAYKWHPRLMYFVGIQFFIWALSGLYMVSTSIHEIHGDDRVAKAPYVDVQQASYPLASVASRFPSFSELKLVQLLEQPFIQVTLSNNPYKAILLSATSGEVLPQLSIEQARQIALNRSTNKAAILNIQLLTALPEYVPARYSPAYEVAFDTWDNLHFYIHASTGEIVTKRHSMWHIFDWMWRLHIMDYDDGENIHNLFLQIVSALGIISVIIGGVLLWSRRRFTKQALFVSRPYHKHLLVAHKWLALLVVAQLLVWLASGLYLSLIEKPRIAALPLAKLDWQQAIPENVSFSELLKNKPAMIEAKLQNVFGAPFIMYTEYEGYHRYFTSSKQLVSLQAGEPQDVKQRQIENYFASLSKPISRIEFVPEQASEIRGEMNAVWSVVSIDNTYYFDAKSAELISTFNFQTRIHDFMMRLHFMDYFGKGHFNHVWNIIFSLALLLVSLTGLVFFWRRLKLFKRRSLHKSVA